MAAKDAIPTPLVTEGLALIAEYEANEKVRAQLAAEQAAAIKPLDDRRKELGDQLRAIELKLIELGAGRYGEGELAALVSRAAPKVKAPDTFVLPEDDEALELARKLAGEHFLTLFKRIVTHEPKPGFDAIADAVLTPAKARDIVALCIVPGQLKGGRCSTVTWPK